MNLLPYRFFILSNYAVSVVLAVLPWLLTDKSSAALLVSVIGVLMLVTSLLSKNKAIPTVNILPVRVVVLIQFTLAVLLSFSHFMLNFSDQVNLVVLIYTASFLTLLSLIVTNISNLEK